jgi:hypothetical protein
MSAPSAPLSVDREASVFWRAWLAARLLGIAGIGIPLSIMSFVHTMALVFYALLPFGDRPAMRISDLLKLELLPFLLPGLALLAFAGRFNPWPRRIAALAFLSFVLLAFYLSLTSTTVASVDKISTFQALLISAGLFLVWLVFFLPMLHRRAIDSVLPPLGFLSIDTLTNIGVAIAAMAVISIVFGVRLEHIIGMTGSPFLLVIYVIVVLLVVLLVRYLRRRFSVDAQSRLERDRRPPVLLLRSFADDNARIKPKSLIAAMQRRRLRLEEVASNLLSGLGPFVAIGKPGEKLPQLGAARAYVSEDAWQVQVLQWMAQARIILLIAGVTPWVKWELSQIKEQRYQHKLIVLLPPGTAQEHRQRLSILSEVLDIPDAGLPPGQETRAIHFSAGGIPVFIASRSARQIGYELSLLNAMSAVISAPRPTSNA